MSGKRRLRRRSLRSGSGQGDARHALMTKLRASKPRPKLFHVTFKVGHENVSFFCPFLTSYPEVAALMACVPDLFRIAGHPAGTPRASDECARPINPACHPTRDDSGHGSIYSAKTKDFVLLATGCTETLAFPSYRISCPAALYPKIPSLHRDIQKFSLSQLASAPFLDDFCEPAC
jgi:hypothetical protein